jgi:hypothetical protein
MRRKVIILDAAKPDFQEIKTSVLSQFGREIWNQVFEEFKIQSTTLACILRLARRLTN